MKTEMEMTSSRSAEHCPGGEDPVWCCLRAQNKREHVAAAHLAQLPGVDVFSPQLRLMRCTRRARFCNTEPLFPGYLFARFDPEQMLEKVNCTPGVRFVLHFGGRLPEIPDAVVAGLRRQLAEISSRILTDAPVEGEEVEIVAGAFAGTKARVVCVLPARQRVRVLLDLMGRAVTTELSLNALLFPRRNGAQLALPPARTRFDDGPATPAAVFDPADPAVCAR